MARANFLRAEKSRFNAVTSCSKVSVDDVEPSAEVPSNVLEESPVGLDLSEKPKDLWP
jgi:hypothetical protein